MLTSIEAERVRNRLTKEEMIKALDIAPKTYYNWISESTEIPSSALLKLSKMFGKSVDYLLEGSIYADADEPRKPEAV